MRYAALFKGINVGGKSVVKMKDLTQLLLSLGLSKVKTYIQSGNAVFETTLDETTLQETIRGSFVERFGFESCTLIRSIDKIRFLIDQLPITAAEIAAAEAADPQVKHLYVYFLDNPPEQVQIDAICKEDKGLDILRAGQRELYFLCHQSIRKSRLAARASKTFDSATVRNWETVNKLYDLMMAL